MYWTGLAQPSFGLRIKDHKIISVGEMIIDWKRILSVIIDNIYIAKVCMAGFSPIQVFKAALVPFFQLIYT